MGSSCLGAETLFSMTPGLTTLTVTPAAASDNANAFE